MKRFVVLDSFRGLCALAVVLFHTYVVQSIAELEFFKNSFVLVEFFFILSGFVLFHTYGQRLNTGSDLKNFFISRTARIFPLHLTMLAVYLVLECGRKLAENKGFSFNEPAFSGATAPHELLPNALLLQSWLNNTITGSFNYPSWSISIEYYLYLIFGALALLARNNKIKIFAVISLVSFITLWNGESWLKLEIFRGTSSFFAGACLYLVYNRIKDLDLHGVDFNLLEIALVLGSYRLIVSSIDHKGVYATLLFCVLILVFSFERGVISRLLSHRVFLWLGSLSFSIYLTHAAILFVYKSGIIVLGKLLHTDFTETLQGHDMPDMMKYISTHSMLLDNGIVLLQLATVLAVSALTYKYVELTGMQLGKRLTRKKNITPDSMQGAAS
ncbi:acyltransferase [Pseudomonas sp. HR96]|uniref:acyltransferase family protein n=1 Tax=Pseudomonas sp. HR96 TaxID=1027966 RepID=UPI002A752A71|nr:acyltransferase [Pseudomonas sp. HR96]WPO97978.1 acyltransferase [Pseudomonas sp. HR96]